MKITRERILKVVNEEVDRYMSEQEGTSKLYVVQTCYDYEGCEVLGVFNDEELAKEASEKYGLANDATEVVAYPANKLEESGRHGEVVYVPTNKRQTTY